ncbi:hypothetical protein TKK_0006243 [Trichogramma kaykai]|uniref:Phosphoenolpyruvate synthase n=1 Tax=Trichogramma kaykai TaxID=54128 RepID=A0ABD2XEY3_9HYME
MPTIDGYDGNCEKQTLCYYGADLQGNSLFVKFKRIARSHSEITLFLSIDDGQTVYEFPEHPNTVIPPHQDRWSARGLRFIVVQMDRIVRIRFDGQLRRGTRENYNANVADVLEHVRFNFSFLAPQDPRWSCRRGLIDNFFNRKIRLDQYGSMRGSVILQDASNRKLALQGLRQFFVGESSPGVRLIVRGMDDFGDGFCSYSKDGSSGTSNNLGHVKDPIYNVRYILSSNLNVQEFGRRFLGENQIDQATFRFETPYSIMSSPRRAMYVLTINLQRNTRKVSYSQYPWAKQTTYWTCTLTLNGYKGRGLIELSEPYVGDCPVAIPEAPIFRVAEDKVGKRSLAKVIGLKRLFSRDPRQIGDKVVLLADAQEMQSEQFEVPDGFCVTTYAFTCFMNQNKNLSEAIDSLINNYRARMPPRVGQDPEEWPKTGSPNLTQILSRIAEEFTKSQMPEDIQSQIKKSMEKILEKAPETRWAVRPSSYFEAPGETFAESVYQTGLGASSDSVIEDVKRMWASVFSRPCVEYRHRCGLPLKAPIAVLVQEMVNARAGGSLFTRHQETGDQREIHIVSTHGLGTPVCSGLVEGDRFVVRRHYDDSLEMLTWTLGKKDDLIDPSGNEIPDEKSKELSISEQVAMKIARIGLEIDKRYDSARDIEWAWTYPEDKIYLLQCRPAASSINTWTDYNLIHELDTDVPAEGQLLTFVQADEMFPQVVTPLTCTTIIHGLAASTYAFYDDNDKDSDDDDDDVDDDHEEDNDDKDKRYEISPLHISNGRVAFKYYNLVKPNRKEIPDKERILRDYGLYGQPIATPEIIDSLKMHNDLGPIDRFTGKSDDKKKYLPKKCEAKLEELETLVRDYYPEHGPTDLSGAALMVELKKHLDVLRKASRRYGYFSRLCFSQLVKVMSLLSADGETFTAQNFADMSRLLGNCKGNYKGIDTAQLPKLLVKMNMEICHGLSCPEKSDENRLKLKDLHVSQIDQWIRRSGNMHAFNDMVEFIKMDGYCGPNEFELESEPLLMRPDRIYKLIQYLHPRLKKPIGKPERTPIFETDEIIPPEEDKEPEIIITNPQEWVAKKIKKVVLSCKNLYKKAQYNEPGLAELVAKIESPIEPETRHRIAKLLPDARRSVALRERARQLLAKVTNNVRSLYAQKAIELVNEGKLPDDKLIYYLTSWEVPQLVESACCPKLVDMARRRRELWARLDEARYPRTGHGLPRPIEQEDLGEEVRKADYQTRGVPVWAGIICNRVFVAARFEDGLQERGLKPWDILVVPYVDAGWSQYFPVLGGLITERGSLFSHGAELARDFKMPCIMGVPNATRIFKTGDGVHMDGSTGEIRREADESAYFVGEGSGSMPLPASLR